MYLSKLRVKNYRSIDLLELTFHKGKNIIVGKNNAGKSNIVKAIDIVLGENSPAYNRYENITLNDFHNGNTEEDIFIWVQLEREQNEQLLYDKMYKEAFGYYYHAVHKNWGAPPYRYSLAESENNVSTFFENISTAMQISKDDENTYTTYINPKKKTERPLEKEFENKNQFAFCFRAFVENDKVLKDIRFFYREDQSSEWIMAFSAPIRNAFLQSAIIHSFRDPSSELRINQWSWFGKLLRESIKPENTSLQDAFTQLEKASNSVFGEIQSKLTDSKTQIAFPGTTISFQFNPGTKIDIYKSTLVYVDDGFKSLLQDKGSGIQSAVIIGLFDYYTRNIAHRACSLLVIEEPELYLHPQARRVISNRLDDFLDKGKNQVIITTHSSEFITSAHEDVNIILVRKEGGKTKAYNTTFEHSKDRQILLKTQNAEMFFADKVILVEGGDKYIFEAVCQDYGKNNKHLGEHWLNDYNYSVIAVGGKGEFWKYAKKLNDLHIPFIIIADFDFLLRGLHEYFNKIEDKNLAQKHSTVMSKISSVPKEDVADNCETLIEQFINDMGREGKTIKKDCIKKCLPSQPKKKKLSDFADTDQEILAAYRTEVRKNRLFILTGELENYYTDSCKESLGGKKLGKEETPIYIVSELVSEDKPISQFIETKEYIEIVEKCKVIMKAKTKLWQGE